MRRPGTLVALRGYSHRVYGVDWSPDGRRLLLAMRLPHYGIGLAFAHPWDPTSTARMIRRPRGLPRHLIVGPGVWSPDGRRIAFAAYRVYPHIAWSRASLWTMDLNGRHLHVVIRHTPPTDYCCIPDALSWQPLPPPGKALSKQRHG